MTKASSSEMPGNLFDLAVPVSDRVQIQKVFISDTRASRADDERFVGGAFRLKYHQAVVSVDLSEERRETKVKLLFSVVTLRDSEPELDPAMSIEATFVLIYSLDSLEGIGDENLNAFAKTNGFYNAWPYWREFVQNTTARMGLPPLVTPVFRFPKAPVEPTRSRLEEEPKQDSSGS